MTQNTISPRFASHGRNRTAPSRLTKAVIDTMAENEIVGIEIFDATKRLPVQSLFRLEIGGDTA